MTARALLAALSLAASACGGESAKDADAAADVAADPPDLRADLAADLAADSGADVAADARAPVDGRDAAADATLDATTGGADTAHTDAADAADAPAAVADAATDLDDDDATPRPDLAPDLPSTRPPMSFFVTSMGSGATGGNLGGILAADSRCATLAGRAGWTGKIWRAFLSTTAAGAFPTTNARDRIGTGPWFNQRGEMVAANLNTLFTTGIAAARVLDEYGMLAPAARHSILTGSTRDGMALPGSNCANWSSNSDVEYVQYGTADGANNTRFSVGRTPCSALGLIRASSDGRIYCFAIN